MLGTEKDCIMMMITLCTCRKWCRGSINCKGRSIARVDRGSIEGISCEIKFHLEVLRKINFTHAKSRVEYVVEFLGSMGVLLEIFYRSSISRDPCLLRHV